MQRVLSEAGHADSSAGELTLDLLDDLLESESALLVHLAEHLRELQLLETEHVSREPLGHLQVELSLLESLLDLCLSQLDLLNFGRSFFQKRLFGFCDSEFP